MKTQPNPTHARILHFWTRLPGRRGRAHRYLVAPPYTREYAWGIFWTKDEAIAWASSVCTPALAALAQPTRIPDGATTVATVPWELSDRIKAILQGEKS